MPDDRYFRSFAVVRAQLLELSSLIAASREDYALQSRLLLDAWNVLSEAPKQELDVWVQASVLRNFAPLVWDSTSDTRPICSGTSPKRSRGHLRSRLHAVS